MNNKGPTVGEDVLISSIKTTPIHPTNPNPVSLQNLKPVRSQNPKPVTPTPIHPTNPKQSTSQKPKSNSSPKPKTNSSPKPKKTSPKPKPNENQIYSIEEIKKDKNHIFLINEKYFEEKDDYELTIGIISYNKKYKIIKEKIEVYYLSKFSMGKNKENYGKYFDELLENSQVIVIEKYENGLINYNLLKCVDLYDFANDIRNKKSKDIIKKFDKINSMIENQVMINTVCINHKNQWYDCGSTIVRFKIELIKYLFK